MTARIEPVWHEDILGPDFQSTLIELGEDPDQEGTNRVALTRYRGSQLQPRALLLIHGMSDYFFHAHVARALFDAGITVYGVDLRKCGRAHTFGQTFHYVSDMRYYIEDLTAAVSIISRDHAELNVCAHSTGALALAPWLSEYSRSTPDGQPIANIPIKSVIYNSPWIAMIGSPRIRPYAGRIAGLISRLRPRGLVRTTATDLYGRSLHRDFEGEWNYNLHFKPLEGFPKRLKWLEAVDRTQRELQRGAFKTQLPTLVLHSEKSSPGTELEQQRTTDTVLDVSDIQRYAGMLSTHIRCVGLPSAIHDVFLSPEPVRGQAIELLKEWILRWSDYEK